MVKLHEREDLPGAGLEEFYRDFFPRFEKLLKDLGLFVQAIDRGFRILPEGNHTLSRVARWLKPYDIDLIVYPSVWNYAKASMSPKQIHVDVLSLISKYPTPYLRHEIRHALNELESLKPHGRFERIFQTFLRAASPTPNPLLPGISYGPYESHFFLDEILAFHQSAKIFLRILKKDIQNDHFGTLAREEVYGHAERFERFLNAWQTTSSIMKKNIMQGSFTTTVRQIDGRRSMLLVILDRTENPDLQGLSVAFDLTPGHKNSTRPTQISVEWILDRFFEVDAAIMRLQPYLQRFIAAVGSFDGLDTAPLDQSLGDLSKAILRLKRELNR